MTAKRNHGKAAVEQLENLHGDLAEVLSQKIKSKEVTAADLAVARQFLKDNGIDGIPTEGSGLGKLVKDLPFQPTESSEGE